MLKNLMQGEIIDTRRKGILKNIWIQDVEQDLKKITRTREEKSALCVPKFMMA